MSLVLELFTIAAVVVGTIFSFLGVLGYLRMPDVYTRLHVVGKVGVFGVVLLLLGAAAWLSQSFGMALVLMGFLLLAGPVTAHALGSAAYRIGVIVKHAIRDDMPGADS